LSLVPSSPLDIRIRFFFLLVCRMAENTEPVSYTYAPSLI